MSIGGGKKFKQTTQPQVGWSKEMRRVESIKARQQPRAPHSEPIAWESTVVGFKQYLTEAQYQRLRPSFQRWYRPYRCAQCAADECSFADDFEQSNPK